MRVLLDTQCWLWMHAQPDRLSPTAFNVIADEQNELFFSAASAWEIAIKYALGKLRLPLPPAEYVPSRMERGSTSALPVVCEHALRVANLPPHHRDPFDRLLVAQCEIERLRLLTADRQFEPYGLDIVWAT
ncbi:MAG TPA: type II toxin-antitoxin system VapC family toxin [Gemmatimonadales bacterium]|nr:type II toxin-antitoxin system VapC family toxin [Gemmatimonadales bacterium]